MLDKRNTIIYQVKKEESAQLFEYYNWSVILSIIK